MKNGKYIDENGKEQKAYGWKQFKRWEYFWESRVNPVTGKFPKTSASEQFEKYSKTYGIKNSQSANWINLGTNTTTGGYAGIGRVATIAFHPTNDNIFWVGTPAGGLWVTNDGGNSWTVLTDNNDVLGVSAIVVPSDYATSNTLYIGTGDRDASDNYSVGVLKSTDGGATWNSTGLTFQPSDNELVNSMLIDPNDNNKIFAAATTGLYKTIDAGTTWNLLVNTEFIDIEFKPGNAGIMYGTTRNGQFYKSTNGGDAWSNTFNSGAGNRMEIAVSANNANRVYIIAANSQNGLKGIYRSDDSGDNFTLVFDSKNLLGWEASGGDTKGQGWYDLALAVDPANADIIYSGGVNTWRSTDGGNNWSIVSHWYGGGGVQAVHADKHYLKFRNNSSTLFECNDGGVYKTDNGTSWINLSNGLTISQIYGLSTAQDLNNETLVGLQDNGTKLQTGTNWTDVLGGDGMKCLIDYTDKNIQYGSQYYGSIYKTTSHWSGGSNISDNIPGGADGAWVTPYILDPNNHETIYVGYSALWKSTDGGSSFENIGSFGSYIHSIAVAPSNSNVIYAATYTSIKRTIDGGNNWTTITSGLPVTDSNIKYIAVKNNDANTAWVALSGYNGNNVFETTDGGNNWTNISAGLPEIPVNCIIQNRLESNTQLYAGTDFGVYIKNGTNDWTPYSTGLPNVVVSELAIYYDNSNPANSRLRCSTYGRGLWETEMDLSGAYAPYIASVSVDNITLNSAVATGEILNDFGNTVTESGFVISTEPNPDLNTTGAIIVSTNPIVTSGTFSVNITGLESGTVYYARAYATNSVGTGYGGSITFNTECSSVVSFPFTEDFENSGLRPICWTEEVVTGDNINWTYQNGGSSGIPAAAHSGMYNAFFGDNDLGEDRTRLIFPILNMSALPYANLRFWHAQATLFSFQDELTVMYKTSADDSWTEIATYTSQLTDWTEEVVALPNLSDEYYIAFEGNALNGRGICIDDVTIELSNSVTNANNNRINIYPNPSSGIFNFYFNDDYNNIKISVTDINGKIIFEKNLTDKKTQIIDLSNYPNGIYFVKYNIDGKLRTDKIILQ